MLTLVGRELSPPKDPTWDTAPGTGKQDKRRNERQPRASRPRLSCAKRTTTLTSTQTPPHRRPSQNQVRHLPPPSPRSHRAGRSPEILARAYGTRTTPLSTVTSTPLGSTPSAAAIPINAVRACSRLNDQGRGIDPPKRYIVTHVDEDGNPLPESVTKSLAKTASKSAKSQSQPKTREVRNVTKTKFQSPTHAIRTWINSLKTNAGNPASIASFQAH
jgi:hypothetical protein